MSLGYVSAGCRYTTVHYGNAESVVNRPINYSRGESDHPGDGMSLTGRSATAEEGGCTSEHPGDDVFQVRAVVP